MNDPGPLRNAEIYCRDGDDDEQSAYSRLSGHASVVEADESDCDEKRDDTATNALFHIIEHPETKIELTPT